MKKRVTGIGGIFFKTADPKKMQDWYDQHLGLNFQGKGYNSFLWKDHLTGEDGRTEFSFFKNDTNYLDPSDSPFMINFRVEDLEGLIHALRGEGVTIIGDIQSYPYGKFGWIMDPAGNKIELWEPMEQGFEQE